MSDERSRRRARRSIVVFVLLAYALSAVFYPIAIRRFHEGADASFVMLALMWCPGVAGLVTRLLFQGNLRGHGLRWGRTRDQVVAYLVPLAYALPVYVPVWIFGAFLPQDGGVSTFLGRHPDAGAWTAAVATTAVSATIGFLVSCLMTTGEELGWRGFLVPEMATVLPFRSVALGSGAIWAVWHVPLIVLAGYRGAGPLWYSLTCFFVMVIAISVLLTWVRLKTGSIWPAVVLHGSHNQFIQGVFDAHTRTTPFTALWTGEFGAGLALTALGIAWIVTRRRSHPARTCSSSTSRPIAPRPAARSRLRVSSRRDAPGYGRTAGASSANQRTSIVELNCASREEAPTISRRAPAGSTHR